MQTTRWRHPAALLLTALLAACDGTTPAAQGSTPTVPNQSAQAASTQVAGASTAPRSTSGAASTSTLPAAGTADCASVPFPSARWTACESANYARVLEAPLEQARSPAFQSRWIVQGIDNLNSNLLRPAVATPVTPLCATGALQCTGDPFRYATAPGANGSTFYQQQGQVTDLVFYDRACARLSARLWLPRHPTGVALPNVIITSGSIEAPQAAYWWAAQALVRAGYAVLTYDPRGQGLSDLQTPSGAQGGNLNPAVFWEGQVDAIDFMRSSPAHPYPHQVQCAGTYATPSAAFNPAWSSIDANRLGIAGHSLGAIGVSVVQGYDAPGAPVWPGRLDAHNPVKVAVTLDSLLAPDGTGFAPITDLPVPTALSDALVQIGTLHLIPAVRPRAPTLSFAADYSAVPVAHVTPPDPDNHKLAFRAWQAAGVPSAVIGIQGTTHYDFSLIPTFPATSWCPPGADGACGAGWALPVIEHYLVAWLDRWLKLPNEPGFADADARLLVDASAKAGSRLSFRYRSARDYPDRAGQRQRCEDLRAGC